jgi:tripartite-type tricarboxylate transporter receptor subunit TctC
MTIARLLLFLAALVALPVPAQWAPSHPVKLVVPFAPGGQPDVVARALADPLSRALGQPVMVENRPGAGGNIAADAVAKSAPDGTTLLVGTNGPLAVSPAIYRNLPYDVARDFAPVTLVGTSPNLIAVNPSLGVATLAGLVTRAKAEPGKLNFSSVGKGSISQLSMELFNSVAGIRTVHIPYNGGAPAVQALISGDVQILSLNPTALIPQMEGGKVRVLAQTSAKRSPLIPAIPTVAESGYPGFEADV